MSLEKEVLEFRAEICFVACVCFVNMFALQSGELPNINEKSQEKGFFSLFCNRNDFFLRCFVLSWNDNLELLMKGSLFAMEVRERQKSQPRVSLR